MRLAICVSVVVLLFASCSRQAPSPLTDAEKSAIRTEIRGAVNSMVRGMEILNIDSALAIFAGVPDFTMVTTDGTPTDYNGFYHVNKEFFVAASAVRLITIRDSIRFLNGDLVLYTWFYSADVTVKTGEHYVNDKVGATLLFKRINSRWKAVYFHESALPPKVTRRH